MACGRNLNICGDVVMPETTFELYGQTFRVEYEYSPAERGLRGPYGEPVTPDIPAEVEVLEIYDEDGCDVAGDMDESDIEIIEQLLNRGGA